MKVLLGEKCIGNVEGDTYRKKVKGSIHKHRAFNAWGFDLGIIKSLKAKGVKVVEVIDTEIPECYTAPIDLILEKGLVREFGHGWQVFLPLSYWTNNSEQVNQGKLFNPET